MQKRFLAIVLSVFLFGSALPVSAQEIASPAPDKVFKAEVIKILEERSVTREDGSDIHQQNVLLKVLEGELKGKEVEFHGIGEVDVLSGQQYRLGDKVLVNGTESPDGTSQYFIIDYIRTGYIYLLAGLFALAIVLTGKMKGVRALFSLAVSFLVILKFMLPQILEGGNPLTFTLLGGVMILATMMYATEGFNRKAHLAVISMAISILLVLLLSWFFTGVMRLSGAAQEESMFLIGVGKQAFDFRGLLLAGMLIGALGVLDDVIIGQIAAVQQIREANPNLSELKVFTGAYKVGNTHLGAIVNTLFLTYTGASLPLLLLFTVKQEPFATFSQVINNELIATEIVRTLVGSIGIALSLPIATYMAVKFLKPKQASIPAIKS